MGRETRCLPGTNDQDTHQGINSVYTVDVGDVPRIEPRHTSVSIRPFKETGREGNFVHRSKGAIGQITRYHLRFKLMLTHGDEAIIKIQWIRAPIRKTEILFALQLSDACASGLNKVYIIRITPLSSDERVYGTSLYFFFFFFHLINYPSFYNSLPCFPYRQSIVDKSYYIFS